MISRRIVCIALLIFSIIILSCNERSADAVTYASLNDSTKYVGIQTCRSCHEDKYQTFIKTGMGLSFDHATKQKSSAVFSEHQVIRDSYRDLNYHLYWNHDSLYINEFRLKGKDTIYQRTEQVSWIVGSGQHTNSHMMNVNGYVYQVPATFYTQKQQWDLPPGFEGGFNSRFSRIIGLECMSCHNAFPKFVEGSENKYDFVANGIDCERCHGPGSKHVEEKKSGKVVDVTKQIDYSIVNPAKLSIDLQLDVCQRCHIQGNAVLKDDKSFLDFRPAMRLSDVMDVYMPVFSGDNNEHIMASHAERMKLSRCFTASLDSAEIYSKDHQSLKPYTNAMTCITCHDPHVSVKSLSAEIFNDKCKSCHHEKNVSKINPAVNANRCTEDPAVRAAVSDNCVSCHMPKNGTIDIPHVTNTDHWIRVQPKTQPVATSKIFSTLACINNMHSSDRSRGIAFLNYFEKFSNNAVYLDSAEKYFDHRDRESIRKNLDLLIRIEYLRKNYEQVIQYATLGSAISLLNKTSITNEHAWSCYRIGQSFESMKDLTGAEAYYSKAVDLAPLIPDFLNKLAGVEADLNETQKAKLNYEFIIRENPKYVSAYVNYGFLLLSVYSDVIKAERMYDKALSLDPDNIQALLNKAAVLLISGRNTEAHQYANRVREIDKNNPKALEILRQMNKNR